MNSVEACAKSSPDLRPSLATALARDVLCKVREGVVTYVSPNATDVSGLPLEAFVGRRMTELIHPDDLRTLERFLTPGWTGEIAATFRIVSGDGGWLERDVRGVREIDERGIHSSVFILRDMAERRRAEDAVVRIEERSRALVAAMPDLMFRLSRDGCYLDFKPADTEEFVIPPEKIIGGYVRDLLDPDLAERVIETIRRTLDEGGVHTLEYSLTKPTGVRETEGRFIACGNDEVLVISRDITDRKRIVRELVQSEQKYRNLVEGARDVVYTIDLQGNFTSANAVVNTVFGYTVEEILGMNLAQIVDSNHLLPYLAENAQFAMPGERIGQPIEFLTYAKDGAACWVEVVAAPITTAGAVTGFQGIARDIGERKRAQERVRFQAKLLDEIGQEAQTAREDAARSEERARIAQELHDNVAQFFFGIGIASTEIMAHPSVSPTVKKKLSQIRRLSAEGGREIRNAIHAIAPPEEALPLSAALAPLLDEMRAAGVHVTYRQQGSAALNASINAMLYATARELLFNVRKHANATEVQVRLLTTVRRATLTVSDNGVGRADGLRASLDDGPGFGLRSIRLRLKQRGGTILATDGRPRGLRIVCTLPLGATS